MNRIQEYLFQLELYRLYTIDWKKSHGITYDIDMDTIKDYLEDLTNGWDGIYSEWIIEAGYGGEYYVCFNEFLDCEYKDESYIESLLNNDELYQIYKTIRKHEEETVNE